MLQHFHTKEFHVHRRRFALTTKEDDLRYIGERNVRMISKDSYFNIIKKSSIILLE